MPRIVSRILFLVMVTATAAAAQSAEQSSLALEQLADWAATSPTEREPLHTLDFAGVPLTQDAAVAAGELLWKEHCELHKKQLEEEWKAKAIRIDDKVMKFDYKVFGKKPAAGWDFYISMHGGGGAPAKLNDQQWKNQIGLYEPKQGIYLAPRAPTNTWNLWHQAHIDTFFTRLIEGAIVCKDVNPDRIYLMGYSAGGDGVYQLAPRMADRFAAAAMMAGHPNETSPLGLRNIPFTLHMGGKDAAYKRNQIARDWKKKLADLRKNDPKGYIHEVVIREGMGHWMKRKDAVAVPWMAKHTRRSRPEKVVWKQDDVVHRQFYWLENTKPDRKARALIVARIKDQDIIIEQAEKVTSFSILLDDSMVDLDQPIRVLYRGEVLSQGRPERTIDKMAETMDRKRDPRLMFPASVAVKIPVAKSAPEEQK